jgi:hypothetical protein
MYYYLFYQGDIMKKYVIMSILMGAVSLVSAETSSAQSKASDSKKIVVSRKISVSSDPKQDIKFDEKPAKELQPGQKQWSSSTKTSKKSSQKKWSASSTKPKETKAKPVELLSARIHENEVDQKVPTFTFSIMNGKTNTSYSLMAKNICGDQELLHPSLMRGPSGLLMEGSQPYKLCTLAMGPGESLTVLAASNDGLEYGEITLIPRPLQASSHGYTLSLRLADPDNKAFQLRAYGFAPREEVRLFSRSGPIQVSKELVANDIGEINTTFVHRTAKELGGEAYVEIEGKNGIASIVYPWGSDYKRELRELKRVERALVKNG